MNCWESWKNSWRLTVNRFSRVPLGEIAPKRDAEMPSSSEFVWNLSLEDIEPQTARVIRRQSCSVGALGSTKCAFDERHVLYSKLRPYLNKVVLPDCRGVGTSELLPLLPDPLRMDREFLAFYLRSPDFVEFAVANSRGANLPRVAMGALWTHKVPIPSLDEQRRIVRRIADCMERIDEVRRLRDGGVRESKAIELAIFHDLLHDGRGVPRWAFVRLGDLTKSSRYGISSRANLEPIGVPILRMGNIVVGYLDFSNLKYVELPGEQKRKYLLRPGDVLINRTNSLELVGKAATFDRQDGEWVYASYLVRIQVDTKRVLPEFVTATINGRIGREYVFRTARRAIGMVNINAKEMEGFPISLPPLCVQRELVDRLAEVRRVSQQIRFGLGAEDADHLSSAVLRKAFAGEL